MEKWFPGALESKQSAPGTFFLSVLTCFDLFFFFPQLQVSVSNSVGEEED